ncbi:MAG: hypothetical protein P8Y23_09560 [Candidatus Lokiarchaeota archaeon]|jgi:hypothetical protein
MLERTILFDLSHNEMLNIYDDDFSNFLFLLEQANLLTKVNESQEITSKILQGIDILVLGNPIDDYFSTIEIKNICDFVRSGGNLLLISEYGADNLQKTNLNDFSGMHFGIFFEKNLIKEINHVNQNRSSILHIKRFQKHDITKGLREVIIGGSCSIFLNKKARPLFFTNEKDVWSEIYNNISGKWIKDKQEVQTIAAFKEYGKGKVVAIGDIDIFTNEKNFGINSLDNPNFIRNLINYLTEPVKESNVISFLLGQLGETQSDVRELTKTMNNIIETLTILEKRLSFLEEKSNILSIKKNTSDLNSESLEED